MPSLPYREARHFLFAMDYTSKRWKHLRARVLREQPLCQEALRYGRREPATVAHHVYPVDDFPGWRFCRWNLIAVSADAHNSFHDRVTGKLTERGLAWQRRVSPPRNAPPPFYFNSHPRVGGDSKNTQNSMQPFVHLRCFMRLLF